MAIGEESVTFTWKDRAHGDVQRTETISGVEFVRRYLRHVFPFGMRAIRRYGGCHAAAKATRERIAFHTGRVLFCGPAPEAAPPKPARLCPCCGGAMWPVMRIMAEWRAGRAPPESPLAHPARAA